MIFSKIKINSFWYPHLIGSRAMIMVSLFSFGGCELYMIWYSFWWKILWEIFSVCSKSQLRSVVAMELLHSASSGVKRVVVILIGFYFLFWISFYSEFHLNGLLNKWCWCEMHTFLWVWNVKGVSYEKSRLLYVELGLWNAYVDVFKDEMCLIFLVQAWWDGILYIKFCDQMLVFKSMLIYNVKNEL